VDFSTTVEPKGNAVAMAANGCGDGTFGVVTQRLPSTGGAAVAADDVGFTILIP
jgi:hypothetical protein